jgi:hypothetical protein
MRSYFATTYLPRASGFAVGKSVDIFFAGTQEVEEAYSFAREFLSP